VVQEFQKQHPQNKNHHEQKPRAWELVADAEKGSTPIEIVEEYLLQNKLSANFIYFNWGYSFYEIFFRYIFLALNVIVLLLFLFYTRCKQYFYEWHTEQRWVLFLLFSLILFNTPLYILEFYGESPLYKFFNTSSRVTFICILLLSLMIFTHSMYRSQSDRQFLSFYLPKFFIMGLIWLFLVIIYTYSSYQSLQDPSFTYRDISYMNYFSYCFFVLIGIYAFFLLYYIIRAGSVIMEVPTSYSRKMKIIWGFTMLIIIGVAIVIIGLSVMGYMTTSVIFLSFQFVFNYYTFLLAFLFCPSNSKIELSMDHIEKERMLQ